MKRALPSRSSQSSRKQECRGAEAAAMVKLVVTAEWAFTEHGPYAWHPKHSPCLISPILRVALGGSFCYPQLADEDTES